MDIKDLLSPKIILGLRADSKDKANMLMAPTKSDESKKIDRLKWSLIVTKFLPHKKKSMET